MDSGEPDWNNIGKAEGDAVTEDFQRQEASSLMDSRAEQSMYDSSNLGGEDDYMSSLGLYDGYDSYNESAGGTTDEEETQDSNFAPPSFSLTTKSGQGVRQRGQRYVGKDSMLTTCEHCGAMGVKHAFYSKSKRFCSLSCSRSFATSQREGKPAGKPITPPHPKKGKPASGRKSMAKSSTPGQKSSVKQDNKAFDWGPYLVTSVATAAPVSCFRHVPMSDSWDQITVGTKLEVINYDCDLATPGYWIASIVKVAGYMGLMRYEGFGNDASRDFWVSLVSPDIHPVGWCAHTGKPLVPPQSIQSKYSDWKEFLVKRLTGARTLPGNFNSLFHEYTESHHLKIGMKIEVVDKMCVSAMRVAIICEIVGGRLRLSYVDSKDEADEFWCHMKSPLIHPVGWSQTVGHKLHASQEYRNSCLSKIAMQKYNGDDASPEMLPKVKDPPYRMTFQAGMKLEAIDPLNLSAICVGTVMKVLRNNYLMIGIDGSPMAESGSDWFCYHATSPCIFPVGFCEINNIELTPPRGYKASFKWFDYLKQTKTVAAPVKLFDKEIPKHGFRPGMKMEAVDLMEPRLICVATVTRIVGRLLRVHFDGWDNEYDQWVDCQSPDIYPVGWCQVMRYNLEGPLSKENSAPVQMHQKKKKPRNQVYKGPRKKRKSKPPPGKPFPPGFRFLSTSSQDSTTRDSSLAGDRHPLVRPPHVPLAPEAVAATLPPLDPDLPLPAKRVKSESELATPMDISPGINATPNLRTANTEGMPSLSAMRSASRASATTVPRIKTEPGLELPETASVVRSSGVTDSVNNNATRGVVAPEKSALDVASFTAALNSPMQLFATSVQISRVGHSLMSGASASMPSPTVVGESGHVTVGASQDPVLSFTPHLQSTPPKLWGVQDVCLFLSINDCAAYKDAFLKKNVTGQQFLDLSAEQIISLAGTKVGPSLRITQLLQQLRTYSAGRAVLAPGSVPVMAPAPMETD